MTEAKTTYRIHWIMGAVLLWEVLFWFVFLLTSYLLGSSIISENINTSGEQLRFERSYFLWGLTALPVLLVGFYYNIRWRRNTINTHFSPRLRSKIIRPFSNSNTFLKFFFFRNAFVLVVFALANPQYGSKQVGGKAESMEVIIALDISKSMLVKDMDQRNTRLEAAKNGVNQLINQFHGDKIGLVIFAGKAYPQLPLTNDYGAAKLFVNEVTTDMISNQGTNIPDALELAINSFSNDETAKSIIVITDGENHEGELETIMEEIKEQNIFVHAVGLGSSKGGPVPEKKGGFKKDETGNVVVSKINPELVKKIGELGGGTYLIESSSYPNFKPLLDATNRLERGTVDSAHFKASQQFGTFFALLAFVLFILSLSWSTNKWGVISKISRI
jgi:Ca-activated chloride channel family protein